MRKPVIAISCCVLVIGVILFYDHVARNNSASHQSDETEKPKVPKPQSIYSKKSYAAPVETVDVSDGKTIQKQIDKQFSEIDGSHHNLTRLIKKAMHNPKSYEHVETTYVDRYDHLIVITTYRGSNVYGGIVKNTVRAKVDISGNVVEILQEK